MVVKVCLGRGWFQWHDLRKADPGIGDVLCKGVDAALGIAVQDEAQMVQCPLPGDGHPVAGRKGIDPHLYEGADLTRKELQQLDPDK